MGHSRGGEAVATAALFNTLSYYPEDANIRFDYHYPDQGAGRHRSGRRPVQTRRRLPVHQGRQLFHHARRERFRRLVRSTAAGSGTTCSTPAGRRFFQSRALYLRRESRPVQYPLGQRRCWQTHRLAPEPETADARTSSDISRRPTSPRSSKPPFRIAASTFPFLMTGA